MVGICVAPQYVAEVLHLEGFTEVHYVEAELTELTTANYQRTASGAIDITLGKGASNSSSTTNIDWSRRPPSA